MDGASGFLLCLEVAGVGWCVVYPAGRRRIRRAAAFGFAAAAGFIFGRIIVFLLLREILFVRTGRTVLIALLLLLFLLRFLAPGDLRPQDGS